MTATKTPAKPTKKMPNSWDLPSVVIFMNVKLKRPRLGTISCYHESAKEYYADDKYIIRDIITGEEFIVAIDAVTNPAKRDMELANTIIDAWREHWEEFHQKINDSLKKFGPGAIFRIGVADGNATYLVTNVKGKYCTINWIGLCCDDYYDHHFRGGGVFQVKDVERYCSVGKKRIFGCARFDKDAPTWAQLEEKGVVPKGMIS
jgi:hypothetical protein